MPPESRRVRALLVVDTASKLAGLDQDRMRMESLLDIIRAENRLDLTVLEGPTATPQQVLRYLRTQPDASADTMLVYYSGHGATDPTRGHALTFTNGGILLRSTLRAELARLRPRLAITLSDCCSNLAKLPPEVGAPGAPDPRPAIRSLFLRIYGVVDINGSTFDPASGIEESAWCQNDGGFFTRAVADAIFLGGMRLDRNRDGLLTWAECLPEIRSNLASIYGNYRKRLLERADAANSPVGAKVRRQPNQTPQAFALDGGSITTVGLSGKALGVMVSPVRVGTAFAVRIDSINPGGPAALAGLEPGDVVLAIDGRGFTSVPEFQRAVATAGDRANLRVRNVRDGRLVDVAVSFGR